MKRTIALGLAALVTCGGALALSLPASAEALDINASTVELGLDASALELDGHAPVVALDIEAPATEQVSDDQMTAYQITVDAPVLHIQTGGTAVITGLIEAASWVDISDAAGNHLGQFWSGPGDHRFTAQLFGLPAGAQTLTLIAENGTRAVVQVQVGFLIDHIADVVQGDAFTITGSGGQPGGLILVLTPTYALIGDTFIAADGSWTLTAESANLAVGPNELTFLGAPDGENVAWVTVTAARYTLEAYAENPVSTVGDPVVIKGHAQPVSVVTIADQNGMLSLAWVDESGQFELTLNDIPVGVWQIVVTSQDAQQVVVDIEVLAAAPVTPGTGGEGGGENGTDVEGETAPGSEGETASDVDGEIALPLTEGGAPAAAGLAQTGGEVPGLAVAGALTALLTGAGIVLLRRHSEA